MNKKEKKFDAVKMVREIRDKLSHQYKQDPELRKKRLKAIRGKYGIPEPKETISK